MTAMKKKLLCLACIAFLFACVLPMRSLALQVGEEFEEDGFWYRVTAAEGTAGTVALVQISGDRLLDQTLTLPSFVERDGARYTVTSLLTRDYKPGLFYWESSTEGSPGSVEMAECTELVIPNTITDPYSVYALEDSASSLYRLTSITVQEGCGVFESRNGILYSRGGTRLSLVPRCYTAETLHIPKDVSEFGREALQSCKAIRSINLESSIAELPEYMFWGCENLESVQLPEGVLSIGVCAFKNCASLTSLELPETVTRIGVSAFSGCESLRELRLPDSLVSLSDTALSKSGVVSLFLPSQVRIEDNSYSPWLRDMPMLEHVEVAEENPYYTSEDGVVYNKEKTELLYCPPQKPSVTVPQSVTVIRSNAFERNGAIQHLELPAGIREIGNCAFQYCSNLRAVAIPDGLKEIGAGVFDDCTSLEEVYLPDSIQSSTIQIFSRCASLKSVHLPQGITKVGSFQNCGSLTSITLPDGVEEIAGYAFSYCSSLKHITFSSKLKTVGTEAFKNCTSLKEAILPDTVEEVDSSAFQGCTAMEQVFLPDLLTQIRDGTFSGCFSLREVRLPQMLKGIDMWAFSRCRSLVSIELPDTLTMLSGTAFQKCSSLEKVIIPSSVKEYFGNPFHECEKLTVFSTSDSPARRMALQYGIPFQPLVYEGTPFTDLYFHWGKEYGKWAYEKKLFLGVTETEFQPDTALSRAMVAAVLHRLAGEPAAGSGASFPDVPRQAYYTGAVDWAAEQGIVLGAENGRFLPEVSVTREELAAMLFRYAKPQADSWESACLAGFADGGTVSGFAEDAMEWAVSAGILRGKQENRLDPRGTATRAEAAAMLMRFAEWKG